MVLGSQAHSDPFSCPHHTQAVFLLCWLSVPPPLIWPLARLCTGHSLGLPSLVRTCSLDLDATFPGKLLGHLRTPAHPNQTAAAPTHGLHLANSSGLWNEGMSSLTWALYPQAPSPLSSSYGHSSTLFKAQLQGLCAGSCPSCSPQPVSPLLSWSPSPDDITSVYLAFEAFIHRFPWPAWMLLEGKEGTNVFPVAPPGWHGSPMTPDRGGSWKYPFPPLSCGPFLLSLSCLWTSQLSFTL